MTRTICWVALLAGVLLMTGWSAPATVQAQAIRVDFQHTNAFIRPLHGVNLGPLCYRGTVDLSAYHRELAIPLTRLHDVPWVNAEAVDIHTIFTDFRNDPERVESYQFAATDDYIAAITAIPSQIVYRLGESIEHTPRQYHVHPPTDPEKWAAICLGIIRHYNRGWGDGFHHNIIYWEIWNEPDVRPSMWTGSDEQYLRLYETTARAIKRQFPEVKIGGPAVGGTGEFAGDEFKPSPFLSKFLDFCQQRQVPLDFFSWHRYSSKPWDLPRRARAMRRLLDAHGFKQTESHLNEWNYLPNDDWHPLLRQGQGAERDRWYNQMGGSAGAAFAACALILLQDAPLDAANFYTGEVQGFGLFNFSGVPKSNFYAFKAFREILNTSVRVEARGSVEGELAVLAGTNVAATEGTLLVANWKSPAAAAFQVQLTDRPWSGSTHYEVYLVDATHDLAQVDMGTLAPTDHILTLHMEAPSVALLKLKRSE